MEIIILVGLRSLVARGDSNITFFVSTLDLNTKIAPLSAKDSDQRTTIGDIKQAERGYADVSGVHPGRIPRQCRGRAVRRNTSSQQRRESAHRERRPAPGEDRKRGIKVEGGLDSRIRTRFVWAACFVQGTTTYSISLPPSVFYLRSIFVLRWFLPPLL